jgi:glycosyltransferase involved in cell wall biosynthesis
MLNLKEYTTRSGEKILYNGNPDLEKLDGLSTGYGDIWHSALQQGYRNAFPELAYQTGVFFWYINDFDGLDQCVSWRINPHAFAIRKSAWELLGGFDPDYDDIRVAALQLGCNALRYQGVVPLFVKDLFAGYPVEDVSVSVRDRYVFFRKNFKADHSVFMLYREGFWKLGEWKAFNYAKKHFKHASAPKPLYPPRALKEIAGTPSVSYIIPTMFRQQFTLNLLRDLAAQSYKPAQVVVVDATPAGERDESLYDPKAYSFELTVIWQATKGSCRARNEAIALCHGDYIVFGDDDIRIPADFIENHIRLLQTYNAGGCNGMDVMADNFQQDLSDLERKLAEREHRRWFVGATQIFSNANSCVRKEYVDALVGNDINYDGGYGEDGDFGLSLIKMGVPVLHNPFSVNLHLKPPAGGYRFWGAQARILGKKRKKQPWELDAPVKFIRPVPSPTLMYQFYKHYTPEQVNEYKHRYFFLFLFKGPKLSFFFRLLRIPLKLLQFKKSVFYAKNLLALGVRTK